MYEIIKSVIGSKKYELTDMLKKIDVLWVQGSITDEEREDLTALARKNAEVNQSIDTMAKLEELDKRVRTLEEIILNNDKPDTEITYPEFEVGKWYYNGDVVAFEGADYICIAPEGQVCTWSPSEYPDYWNEYAEDVTIE